MTPKKINSNPSKWPELYSAEQAHWQDSQRILSFVLAIFLTLAIAILYLVIYNSIYPDQLIGQSDLGIADFIVLLARRLAFPFFILLVIILVGLGLLLYVTSQFIKAFYKPPDDIKPVKLILSRLFGIPAFPPFSMFFGYPFVLLDAKETSEGKSSLEKHPVHWFGGPALLIVFDGTGIYVQRGNKFSRTLGPGIYFLDRFETIRDIVDLRPQTMSSGQAGTPPPISGRTKDGIKIKFNVELSFRIVPNSIKNPEKHEKRKIRRTKVERDAEERYLIKSPVYSGDPESIRKAVERTTVKLSKDKKHCESKWCDGIWGHVSGELAKYITRHYLDELLVFENADDNKPPAHYLNARKGIEQKNIVVNKSGQLLSEREREIILNDLNNSLRDTTGVIITDLRITDFELPPEVYEQRLKMLETESISRIKCIEGDTAAEQILIREKGRTQAQRDLIASLADSLAKVGEDSFADAVLLSLSNVLSQGLEDPMGSAYFAKDTFDTLDHLRDFLKRKEQQQGNNLSEGKDNDSI